MCGRYTLTTDWNDVENEFGLPEPLSSQPQPRYNIAPTQHVPIVALNNDRVTPKAAMLQWGVLPSWAESKKAPRPINARAESVTWKFGDQLDSQRCLIPADGFYEWSGTGKGKTATHFRMADRRVFAFAGLWDVWRRDGKLVASSCIITSEPNGLVRLFHDRMPVIVPRESYSAWLDFETPEPELIRLLRPFPARGLRRCRRGRG